MTTIQQHKVPIGDDRLELSDHYKRIYEDAVKRAALDDDQGLELRIGVKRDSATNFI